VNRWARANFFFINICDVYTKIRSIANLKICSSTGVGNRYENEHMSNDIVSINSISTPHTHPRQQFRNESSSQHNSLCMMLL
jgi:hypothetical protein